MAQEKTAPEKSHREQQLAEFDSVLQHTKAYEMAVPDGIKEWLGRALLLYGVPFNYLVPDPRMLPPESIRFFHLDPGWVYRLLEGACSVGRTTSREQVIDQELGNRFLREAPAAAAQVRPAARESADGEPRPPAKVPEVQWPLTGFLLRSRVVEGWQGLEMTATGTQGVETAVKQLEPLRIDRLGPDTMLCIFNGKVTRIVVKQPPEGMHFGADPIPNSKRFEKGGLRRVDRSGNAEPGDYAQAAKVDNVPIDRKSVV